MDFPVPAKYSVKMKESDNIDKYLDLAGEPKSFGTWIGWRYKLLWEHLERFSKLGKMLREIGNQRKNKSYPNNKIGDLKRLAVAN